MESCFEEIYLYVGSGLRLRDRIYLYYDVYVVFCLVLCMCLCCLFFSSIFGSLFLFWEFINGECELRWTCCGEIVA